jgi:hypothetical protein
MLGWNSVEVAIVTDYQGKRFDERGSRMGRFGRGVAGVYKCIVGCAGPTAGPRARHAREVVKWPHLSPPLQQYAQTYTALIRRIQGLSITESHTTTLDLHRSLSVRVLRRAGLEMGRTNRAGYPGHLAGPWSFEGLFRLVHNTPAIRGLWWVLNHPL